MIADFLIIINILASCSFYPENSKNNSEISGEEIATEKREETTLVLSCFRGVPNYISNAVEIFNSEDNGYNITVRDYSQFIGEMPAEGDENAEEKINKAYAQAYQKFFDDCISGTEIDIIYNDNQIPYMDKLASSGVLADLYEFPDSIFAEMNSNIISESEMNGQLFEMPLSFTINTLIGMEQYSKKNWSVDDFIDCCNSLPDDVLLCNPEYRTGVYDILVTYNMMSFFSVDNEAGFNSDEYRKAVNFCLNFSNDTVYIEDSDYDKYFLQNLYIHNFGSFHSSIEDFEA